MDIRNYHLLWGCLEALDALPEDSRKGTKCFITCKARQAMRIPQLVLWKFKVKGHRTTHVGLSRCHGLHAESA